MTNQSETGQTGPSQAGVRQTLLDLLQGRPELAARFGYFQAAFVDQQLVPERLLEICRTRIDALHNMPPEPTQTLSSDDAALVRDGNFSTLSVTEAAALFLAEQLAIDAHGVNDAQVSKLSQALGEPGTVTLLTAVALFDANARMLRVLAPLRDRRTNLLQ